MAIWTYSKVILLHQIIPERRVYLCTHFESKLYNDLKFPGGALHEIHMLVRLPFLSHACMLKTSWFMGLSDFFSGYYHFLLNGWKANSKFGKWNVASQNRTKVENAGSSDGRITFQKFWELELVKNDIRNSAFIKCRQVKFHLKKISILFFL